MEPSKQPANKRARTNDESADDNVRDDVLDPISPSVLGRADELARAYRDALPYPHGIVRDFCAMGFLEGVLSELKRHTKVKFKETDLFRVYQSIDLGNLRAGNDLAERMPSLMRLKDAIYSPECRAFVERIAGLDPGSLTDEVDCAANCHAKGCHLLCHDDVIGTRAISYIIYLTDASPHWKDEDGGRLELYEALPEEEKDDEEEEEVGCGSSSRRRWVPAALPSKTILPEFNSLAYFAVRPGVSFHSVQEVFADRPRLSIQGWYHAKGTPSGIEDATLRRLKSNGKGEDTEGDFEPLLATLSSAAMPRPGSSGESYDDEGDALSPDDLSFLGRYINATYLTDGSMNTIRERFEEESSVKLRHFLTDEWNGIISRASSREDQMDGLGNDRPALDYRVGANDDWRVVGPAHKQRFLEYNGSDDDDTAAVTYKNDPGPPLTTGDSLRHLRRAVFQSAPFGKWLGSVTSLGIPLGQRGRIRRFRPGLDYTVAHYGVLTTNPVLDATLCFCAGDGEQCAFDEETNDLLGSDDDAIWESGDVGGFECYIAADEGGGGEDGGPDAEYDEEDDTKLLSVSASNNTLSIVYRDPGTMRFVKYVGAGAPSSRWDIALEYEVDSSDDADSEQHGDDHQ